jgi:hypothetical protein
MILAGIAQLVEQLIRNQQVVGSSPIPGSSFSSKINIVTEDTQKAENAESDNIVPTSDEAGLDYEI